MRPPARPPSVLLCAAVLAACALASAQDGGGADRAEAVRRQLAGAGRTVRSADGLVRVTVPAAVAGADALTLLRFTGDVRERLSDLLDEPLGDDAFALDLRVLEAAEGAPASVFGGTRRGVSPPMPYVVVRDLGNVAPEEVTAALCGAYLRADAIVAGWTDDGDRGASTRSAPSRRPYPAWMARGVARLLDVAARQPDAERAIVLLESGALPPLAVLFRPEGSPAEDDPALASQLAAWLLDGSPRGERFRSVRSAFAGRGASFADGLFALATGTADPATAEAHWRRWLSARRWAILTPGSSHPAFVRRLRGLLALHLPTPAAADGAEASLPPELAAQPDILARIPRDAYDATGGTILPEALVVHADAAWAPHAAMALSGRLLRVSAGHGDDVLAVARAYGGFFEAVRSHEPRAVLVRLLADADARLAALEQGKGGPER